MKKLCTTLTVFLIFFTNANAETIDEPTLLDGTKVTFYYQNGWGAHVEFYDGMLKYEWVAGPAKGRGNQDLPYRSRKIDDETYIVNWLEESNPDFVTLIFNFTNNVMYSSALLRFASDKQTISFNGGIIQELDLVVKE